MHSETDAIPVQSTHVLYLGSDAVLARRLRPLLVQQGIELCTSPGAGEPSPLAPGCAAVLLDSAAMRPNQTIQDLLGVLKGAAGEAPPVAVIAHTKDIRPRLQAMRAGAAAYFYSPVAFGTLAERLVQLCRPRRNETGRVLVVEDSAMQAILAERVLGAAGFSVRVLTEPLRIIEALDDYQPDLVLMDLHMPVASGAELATIVREHESFGVVPIVFLSEEKDPETQVHALSKGGDLFISKPIVPKLLVAAVTQRIAISRALRQRCGVSDHLDPDTGLSTRHHFMSVLERTLAEPGIGEEPGIGLLTIALDGVSRIREQVGTGGGDLVHDRVGQMIRGRLGPGDLAARLDNHRHGVLVRRPADDALCAYAEELKLAIAGYPVGVAGKTVAVTASIGVGFFRPPASDSLAMIARAESACAEALSAGGDRVVAHLPRDLGLEDTAYEERIAALIDRAVAEEGPGGGFRVLYQPLVSVQAQARKYVEVLLCLDEPGGETLSAETFAPIAQRCGRVLALDRWLMLRSLEVLREHGPAQPRLRLFVRQHVESLASKGWVQWLRDQLVSYGAAERRPVVELGIADVLKNRQLAPMPLKQLRKLGIKICLAEVDHAPVAQDLVTDFQPQFVKLAPQATRQFEQSRLSRLVDSLHRHGAEAIACGIDYPDQIGPVWASGVNYAQGTLIQEPLSQPVFD